MQFNELSSEKVSSWWRRAVILVLVAGFGVLIWVSARSYRDAPPIPQKVVSLAGEEIFTRADILAGQEVFLRYGLMENGTIWGHGAYLGPDFSAEYLHSLATDANEMLARTIYNRSLPELTAVERSVVEAEVRQLLYYWDVTW